MNGSVNPHKSHVSPSSKSHDINPGFNIKPGYADADRGNPCIDLGSETTNPFLKSTNDILYKIFFVWSFNAHSNCHFETILNSIILNVLIRFHNKWK